MAQVSPLSHWDNPQVFERSKEAAHATSCPTPMKLALAGDRAASPIPLADGTWKFSLRESASALETWPTGPRR